MLDGGRFYSHSTLRVKTPWRAATGVRDQWTVAGLWLIVMRRLAAVALGGRHALTETRNLPPRKGHRLDD